jgi:sec-independent protein translocase protein TatA
LLIVAQKDCIFVAYKADSFFKLVGIKIKTILYSNIMQTALILFALGMPEIILIALVVLLLFGGKKIPELMRGIGKGVNQFKKGMNEVENEITFPDQKKEEKK